MCFRCVVEIKRYLWDGNVLLHEWEYNAVDEPQLLVSPIGEVTFDKEEPIENLTTWVYENGSFAPIGKLTDNESFSIVIDYLGTPVQAYDQSGNLIWERELDIYGRVRKEKGISNFVPFRYQGQYYDGEIDLCYNRFRYYDCNTGTYISKDPIGLLGGFALYGYVKDVNKFVDIFGLWSIMDEIPSFKGWQRHHIIPKSLGGYNTTGYIHEVIKLSGIDVDKISRNIIHLPMFEGIDDTRSLHNGGHSKYTETVKKYLDNILKEGEKLNANTDFYKNKLLDLMDEFRDGLISGKIKCKN